MKHPTLRGSFRLLFATYWLSLFFPPLVLAGALFSGSLSLGAALYGQGLFTLLAALGSGCTHRFRERRGLLGLMRPFLALFCAAAGFFLSPFPGLSPVFVLLARLLFSLLCAAAFIAGTLFYGHSYAGLQTGRPILWLAIFHLGAGAVLWGLSRAGLAAYRLEPLCLSLIFAFSAYSLCCNQANIDFHMERRRHRLELLPQKIRIYNLWLMLGVLALALLLFLLRSQIADGLRLLAQGLKQFIAGILFLLGKLIELFYREKELPPDNLEAAAPPLAAFVEEPYKSISDFWFYLFMAVTLCGLLWWKCREILQLLLSVLGKLGVLIRRLFSFAPILHRAGGEAESPYYIDEIVSLAPEQERLRRSAGRVAAREWKKAYERYARMPEDSEEKKREKFRAGYRLVLQYLASSGCYKSGCTVHELEQLALPLPGMQGYADAADSYDHIRYGEYAPSAADFASLQHTLAGIAGPACGKRSR